MPDEINVDADEFDRILSRMLAVKPLSKTDISERIKEKREAGRIRLLEKQEKNKRHKSKKLGQ
jgi:hypothetical protein